MSRLFPSSLLDKAAPAEGFTLTPEMRAGIERGLAQADAGQLVGFGQVRETLARYKAEWRDLITV